MSSESTTTTKTAVYRHEPPPKTRFRPPTLKPDTPQCSESSHKQPLDSQQGQIGPETPNPAGTVPPPPPELESPNLVENRAPNRILNAGSGRAHQVLDQMPDRHLAEPGAKGPRFSPMNAGRDQTSPSLVPRSSILTDENGVVAEEPEVAADAYNVFDEMPKRVGR